MKSWNPRVKPPADVCPQRFCFHWAAPGDRIDVSGGDYDSFEEAVNAATHTVEIGRCACVFGFCTRVAPGHGERDWYEPNERALRDSGLPWFYFIPAAEKLAVEFRDQYLAESAALWGSAEEE